MEFIDYIARYNKLESNRVIFNSIFNSDAYQNLEILENKVLLYLHFVGHLKENHSYIIREISLPKDWEVENRLKQCDIEIIEFGVFGGITIDIINNKHHNLAKLALINNSVYLISYSEWCNILAEDRKKNRVI